MRFGSRFGAAVLAGSFVAAANAQSPEPTEGKKETGLLAAAQRLYGRVSDAFEETGLQPRLSNISADSGPAPGMAYWRPRVTGTNVDLFASASRSFRGDQLLELRLGRVPHRPGAFPSRRDGLEFIPAFEAGPAASRFFLYAEVRKMDFAHYHLDGEPASLTQTNFDVVAGYRLGTHLAASVRAGRVEVESATGVAAAQPSADAVSAAFGPGWRRDYYRAASEIAFDNRDHARNPHSGNFVGLNLEHFQDRSTTAATFSRVTLDARRYQSLGSPRHVIALHGFASAVAGCSGEQVPAFLRSSLGGGSTLRGFSRDRFTGDQLFALSAEYRFEVFPAWELAPFYDLGQAWGGMARLNTPGVVTSYGLGLRFKTANQVLVRLDAGRGTDGTRVHLKFGYSF